MSFLRPLTNRRTPPPPSSVDLPLPPTARNTNEISQMKHNNRVILCLAVLAIVLPNMMFTQVGMIQDMKSFWGYLNGGRLVTEDEQQQGDKKEVEFGEQGEKEEVEIGFIMVHCKEQNLTFLKEPILLNQWSLTVYETCGGNITGDNRSLAFKNAGSEECSSYLDFIVQNYERLPKITVFGQSDLLDGFGKPVRDYQGHAPFASIKEMEAEVRKRMMPETVGLQQKSQTTTTTINTTGTTTADPTTQGPHQNQTVTEFLHFGPYLPHFHSYITKSDKGVIPKGVKKEIWAAMGMPEPDKSTVTVGRPGACFAVHRNRIVRHPKAVYEHIRDLVFASNKTDRMQGREQCWALENTWHVLFGEPLVLPVSSSLDRYPRREKGEPRPNNTALMR